MFLDKGGSEASSDEESLFFSAILLPWASIEDGTGKGRGISGMSEHISIVRRCSRQNLRFGAGESRKP
jgi:hypothetical protein